MASSTSPPGEPGAGALTHEACVLLDAAGCPLWSDGSGTVAALPDSRARWDAIWRHREVLAEIAHSHPGGSLAFSTVDTTTMAAIDAALGRRLRYSVVTDENVLRRDENGDTVVVRPEPGWAELVRRASR